MSSTETATPDQLESQRDALVGRLFNAAIESLELIHVYIGDRLGLYAALQAKGPLTAAGLAGEAGINERYTREWLEQQAIAGILTVDTSEEPEEARRFALPPGHAEVLLDADSLNYLAPVASGVASIASVMPLVLEAFRSGKGVPYAAYGQDIRDCIARVNRPMFLKQLASWFAAIPDVDARLREPGARVADVGCGSGWSAIALARAYPLATVNGLDLDDVSIEQARRNADAEGLADRVTFEARDAADPGLAGSFDLVTAFETIHDMSHPVDVLRAMRGLAKDGGAVVIADERVAEEFSAPGDEMERFNYGWSAVHCLAVGMVEADAAGTGTVMRPSKLREYAVAAGFKDAEILPIEHDFWRFYRATI